MRCLDSGTPAAGAIWRSAGLHGDRARCGNCGRVVDVVAGDDERPFDTLANHGGREPCPLCGSRSPRHHPTDHEPPSVDAERPLRDAEPPGGGGTRCGYCGRLLVRQPARPGWSCPRCVLLLAQVRTPAEWAAFHRQARRDWQGPP